MKKSISTFLILSLSLTVFSQDFRSSFWGDSWAKVKASEPSSTEWSEKAKANDGTDYYYFKTTVASIDALTAYYFIEDTLVKAAYLFISQHSNRNDYLLDFERVMKSIEAKYGEVDLNKAWRNDLYQDDPAEYGFAVSLGHYMMGYDLETDRSQISHQLFGENYEISHLLQYTSILHTELIKAAEEKAKKNIF